MTVAVHRHTFQVLLLTLAVILGPAIAVAYHLTQPIDAEIGSFSIAQAIRGLLGALMFFSLFLSGELRLLKYRLVRPLLFLAVWAVLTVFASPYPYQHIVLAVKMMFLAVVFVGALHLAKERLIGERWLTTCGWVVLLTMAACIGFGLITGRTVGVYKTRYATAGLMSNVGVSAIMILSSLPILIRGAAVSSAAVAGIGILYTSLFFTMRRSALIAAAVATGYSFVVSLKPLRARIRWRRILVPLGILLLLAGIGLNTPAGTDLMTRFRDLDPRGGTGSDRYIFWRISLEHILHRPAHAQLWGEGMGSIRDFLKQSYGMAIPSHNDWLDLVNAFGLCGLIGMGWWYWELARFALRLRDQREGLFQGMCTAVIILGLMSIGTGGTFEPHWTLTYAAMGFWAGKTVYAIPTRDDS